MASNFFVKIVIILFVFIIHCSQILHADERQKNIIPKKMGGLGWAYSTESEFQAFPEYCKARFYPPKSAMHKKWKKKIGSDFIHFHHY